MILTAGNITIIRDESGGYNVGHTLDQAETNFMNNLWYSNVTAKLKQYLKAKPDASLVEFQAEAKHIQETLVLDVSEEPDPIQTEAIAISKERILSQLAAEGLPAPNNINIHASELAKDSKILALAKLRVEARLRAGLDLISGV